MENNETFRNDKLLTAIKGLRESENAQTQSVFITELTKARYIVPVTADDQDTTEDGKQIVAFSSLTNHEGDSFFMVYTDIENLQKWNHAAGKKVVSMDYYQVIDITLKEDANFQGFVINPFSDNFVFSNQNIPIVNRTLAMASGAGAPKTLFGIPKEIPAVLMEGFHEVFEKHESVKKAYFCMMVENNTETHLVIVDSKENDKNYFGQLQEDLIPYLGNEKMLRILTVNDDLGKRALNSKLPAVYRRA